MKLKAVLVALAVAAFAAAGALAEAPPPPSGTTGPGGAGHPGRPGGPPPGRSHDQGQGGSDQGEPGRGNQGPGGRAGNRTFRQQLSAAGYRCLPRPVQVMGSLTAVGTDSITVHPLRLRTDVTVKVLAATQFFRIGKPARITDLVVERPRRRDRRCVPRGHEHADDHRQDGDDRPDGRDRCAADAADARRAAGRLAARALPHPHHHG